MASASLEEENAGLAPRKTEPVEVTKSVKSIVAASTNGLQVGAGQRDSSSHVNGDEVGATRDAKEHTHAHQLPIAGNLPEVEHFALGYISVSMLVQRAVQETFNSLEGMIQTLADVPLPNALTNGALQASQRHGVLAVEGVAETNIHKKSKLFEYANTRRAQFIKLLVLSRWARQAAVVSQAIDLRIWLAEQDQEYRVAIWWMGELKRELAAVRQPRPDISRALEVCSQQRADWLPNLQYFVREPLSPQDLRDGFRSLKAVLSNRFNAYEITPPMSRDFSISAGRVTLRIPDEFEVDVSLADEDHTTQLYYIDFRPSFTPALLGVATSVTQGELASTLNDQLAQDGLPGLFSFLHNLILTQKLAILRHQALDLARGPWSKQLTLEPVRRNLVLQYWSHRPGPKNWIELGVIRRGQQRVDSDIYRDLNSTLGLRWFKSGNEVKDFVPDLRLASLSILHILNQIIAHHSSSFMKKIYQDVMSNPRYTRGNLRMRLVTSAHDPTEVSLLLQISSNKAIKLTQEPISGKFSIYPPSQATYHIERELNRQAHPDREAARLISSLCSAAMQEEVGAAARQCGWEVVSGVSTQSADMHRVFGHSPELARFYRRPDWSNEWVVGFLTSASRDSWWVASLVEDNGFLKSLSSSTDTRRPITAAYELSAPLPDQCNTCDGKTLLEIEKDAVSLISQLMDTRELVRRRVPHAILVVPTAQDRPRSFCTYFQLPQVTRPLSSTAHHDSAQWMNNFMKIDYRGLDGVHSQSVRVASARISRQSADENGRASVMPGAAFNKAANAFALLLHGKVGDSIVPKLTKKLIAFERMQNLSTVITAHGLEAETISEDKTAFVYSRSPVNLKATLHFATGKPLRMTLSSPNPHIRILDHLNNVLHSRGLAVVLSSMQTSLPLLSCLDILEADISRARVMVAARSEQHYQLSYKVPSHKYSFDIRLAKRRNLICWHIPESSIKHGTKCPSDDAQQQALQAITRGHGPGWRGMKGGIVASVSGIPDAVNALHITLSNAIRTQATTVQSGTTSTPERVLEVN